MIGRWLHIAFPLLLFSPFLILLAKSDLDLSQAILLAPEWLGVLKSSSVQALLSSLFSVGLGTLGALGLLSLDSSFRLRAFRFLVILPSLLPPVVVGSLLLLLSDQVGVSIQGLSAVVFAHVVMNSGLCALLLESHVRFRLSGNILAARSMGASDAVIAWSVFLPQCWREIQSALFLVFGLCLMSFMLPMMLAPGMELSLEVYIYNHLKSSFDFQTAVVASLVQMGLVGLVVFKLFPQKVRVGEISAYYQKLFSQSILLLVPILIAGLFVFALVIEFSLLPLALNQVEPLFWQELASAFWVSAKIMISTLAVSCGLMVLILYTVPRERLHRLLLAAVPLSPVVLGFALWSLGGNFEPLSTLKIALAVSWLHFPAFYRWRLGPFIDGLRNQIQIARSMGASDFQVFLKIVWPQSQQVVGFLLAIVCVWASGDFVMTSVLSFSSGSLPLLVENLATSYRLELATLVSVFTLLLGGAGGLVVWMSFRIFSREAFGVSR